MKTKKRKVGRPTKYHIGLCSQMIQYFSVEPYKVVKTMVGHIKQACDIPMLIKFAQTVNVPYYTMEKWLREHEEFRRAYSHCKQLQERIMVTNTLHKLYDSKFAYFASKNMFGWRDEVQIEHSVADETVEKLKDLSNDELQVRINRLTHGNAN